MYHQGDQADGIYCVQTGLVGIRRIDESGNSALLKTISAGTTTGYHAFLSREPHSNSAEILVPGTVCFIREAAVSRLLEESPILGERFLAHTFADLKDLEDRYSRSLTLSAQSRFLHLIMVYYRQSGVINADGLPSVNIPVSRTHLSEILGIKPETLSRLIRRVQSDGLVRIKERNVVIPEIDRALLESGVFQ